MESKIKAVKAKEILDSRGDPTIEVDLTTSDGLFCAAVPSGASKGKYEALELRDNGKRFGGKGVLKAVENVDKIIGPKLEGLNPAKQNEIDELMIKLDGTGNKSKLGANAILGVSMAVCRAGAGAKKVSLYEHISQLYGKSLAEKWIPEPCFNVINGGAHAANDLDFQEFLVVLRIKPFSEALAVGIKIYRQLSELVNEKYGKPGLVLGDEGGFAPPLKTADEALDLIVAAAEKSVDKSKIKIILDIAASQFFKDGQYEMKTGSLSRQKLCDYYLGLLKKYPIIGLEDAFFEDDWPGFQDIMAKIGSKTLIIGDDLVATNQKRMTEAKKKNACNTMILKLNQIGTVSEAIEAAKMARDFGWKVIVSHRSGETNDDFIADFSVGISADFIKSGAPEKKERAAKYNRLLKIEEELESAK